MSEKETIHFIEIYIKNGWVLTPVKQGQKRPFKKGWQKEDKTDLQKVQSYYESNPDHNVAIVTGKVSNLIVIDIDVKDGAGGDESLKELEQENYKLETYTVRTPTGGWHFYYRYPDNIEQVKNVVGVMDGIDVRGDKGCVIAPPSRTDKGAYEIVKDIPVAPLPDFLLELILSSPESKEDNDSGEIKKGGRNNTVFLRGCSMKRYGLNEDEIRENLFLIGQKECNPPLEDTEIESILKSVSSYTFDEHDTELGNSKRFSSQHRHNVRYIYAFKKWLVYGDDNGIWRIDDNGEIIRLAEETVKSIWREVVDAKDSDVRKAKRKHAQKSEDASKINAMIKLAQADPMIASVRPDDLDPALDHVAAQNAFINLKTGEIRPVQREDLVTKHLLTNYDEKATCPRWEDFVREICCGKEELYLNMQRIFGYCLTGETREQALFVLLGPGGNGKSTFLNVMGAMLGELSITTPIQTFTQQDGNKIPNDIARMQSRRIVLTSEADEKMVFSEPLIKMLTGQDRIPARYLYGEYFEFMPQFKIMMAVNNLPKIKGNDPAIWRRFKINPFKAFIPKSERDPELITKLKAEMPGILNWCIAGAVDWYQNGMQYCDEILRETQDYKNDMDAVGKWLTKYYEHDVDRCWTLKELFKDFCQWRHGTDWPWIGKKEFSVIMQEKGFRKARAGGETVFYGIELKGVRDAPF